MLNLNNFFALKQIRSSKSPYRDLIRAEAQIGGQMFGNVPINRRREFFCLDQKTWVWHEEWYDTSSQLQSKTTRYEILRDRVLKFQDGQYYGLDRDELLNFYKAVRLYNKKIRSELYANVA